MSTPEMSTATRGLFRTVGQLALVLALTEGLVNNVDQLYRCVRGDELSPLWCMSLFDPHVLPFTIVGFAATGLAALGWWATLRAGRARAWIAQGCAVLLAAPGAVWLVRGLVIAHDTATSVWGMCVWVWAVGFLARAVPLVLLVLSYRGRPLNVDEPGALCWIVSVPAPSVLLGVVYHELDTVVDLPPLTPLITALCAGACYAVMRRRRALPGAGRWLPATLILTALLVPEYCWLGSQGWANPTEAIPAQLARDTIAWAVALSTVAVLAVAVARRGTVARRRQPHPGHPRRSHPAGTG